MEEDDRESKRSKKTSERSVNGNKQTWERKECIHSKKCHPSNKTVHPSIVLVRREIRLFLDGSQHSKGKDNKSSNLFLIEHIMFAVELSRCIFKKKAKYFSWYCVLLFTVHFFNNCLYLLDHWETSLCFNARNQFIKLVSIQTNSANKKLIKLLIIFCCSSEQ
jgi:hypothetical protein